jgi:serine/threonine-protein kinase
MVMEYVEGSTLRELITREARLPPERVAHILDQAAGALMVAHDRGIWHRDIKPANLMIVEGPDGDQLKLADFGVAKRLDANLDVDDPKATDVGMLVGTPAYMSPEQIDGDASAGCDLWSLAVCAYEAVTGKDAFPGERSEDVLRLIAMRAVRPPSHHVALPRALDRWFERALARRSQDRFQDASELARTFRTAARSPIRRRKAVRVAVGVGVATAALATAAALMWQPAESKARTEMPAEPLRTRLEDDGPAAPDIRNAEETSPMADGSASLPGGEPAVEPTERPPHRAADANRTAPRLFGAANADAAAPPAGVAPRGAPSTAPAAKPTQTAPEAAPAPRPFDPSEVL